MNRYSNYSTARLAKVCKSEEAKTDTFAEEARKNADSLIKEYAPLEESSSKIKSEVDKIRKLKDLLK